MVVGGNDDLVWPDLSRGSFDFGRIWIVICPNLEVVTQACMFFLDVFQEDYFLILVSVPPFVWHLYVGVWISSSAMSRLASSCWSIMPFVLEFCESLLLSGMEFVESGGLFEFYIVFDVNSAICNHSL